MTMEPLPAPAPPVNPETKPFWDATSQARLLVKQCQDCQSLIWYPRTICPECSCLRTSWLQVSGRGRIYSYTVNHRGEGPYQGCGPYVLTYVELEEGPRMMTNIVETDGRELAAGDPHSPPFRQAFRPGEVYVH
jgi:uncharacterized protein